MTTGEETAKLLGEALATTVREKRQARAEGYAAGLEAAAEWHDTELAFVTACPDTEVRTARMLVHRDAAKAIRALGKEGP